MAATRGRIYMVSFSLLTMRTIDFPAESFSYEQQANLVEVTHRDRKSRAVLNQVLVEPRIASKHFAQKLASWKAMSRSKK
jgi:hypothetical protein